MSIQLDENHQFCSFIVFGKPGVGKSTLLNYISGSTQFLSSSSGASCTKEVKSHEFQVNNTTVTLFDTQGLYDTNGIDEDKKNIKNLVDFLRKYEHGLNGIAIVISSTDYRLNIIIKKSIKLLYQIFGNNIWSHLCFIVTHCPFYQEDLDELKESMTSDKDSLKALIIELIKGICHINEEPSIPFYFVDSLHPNFPPFREAFSQLKIWFLGLSSFRTDNLIEPSFEYQYKEKQSNSETFSGKLCPIYDYIRGETKKITIKETIPVAVKKKKRVPIKEREPPPFGILRCLMLFPPKYEEIEYDDIEYHEREKVVEYPGDLQKVLIGYYQEIKIITKSWFAYWDYEEDIIDKKKPTYKSNYEIANETTFDYFDTQQNRLSPNTDSIKINILKKLIQ